METVQARYLARLAQDSDPEKLRQMWQKSLKYFSSRDRAVLEKPEEAELECDIFRQVYKQGTEGHIAEAKLMTSHWGFDLEDVKYDKIQMWYGSADVNTPVRMGEYMQKRLPHADLHVYPGESHYTIWNHIEEMLKQLLKE